MIIIKNNGFVFICFRPFYLLQKNAYEIVRRRTPKNKLLEDYLTILHQEAQSLNENKFREIIQPLVSIAANNGFEFMPF